MTRLPRYNLPGYPQHVIIRGNNRNSVFTEPKDYLFFLDCLETASTDYRCAIHAYVLMTNHIHLLMTPEHEESVGKTMQSVGRRYVQRFNYRHGRTGTLWEGRYRATLIDTDAYLLTCYRYIELNPVRAGLVDHPDKYAWSSFASNALGKADKLITPHPLYTDLASSETERLAAYRGLFETDPLAQATLGAIRDATNKAWILGSELFRKRLGAELSRRTAPLPKGRRKP